MDAFEYWNQPARLFRGGGGIAFSPEPVMWREPAVVRDGALAHIVADFMDLPRSHRPYYAIITRDARYMRSTEIVALSRQTDFPGRMAPLAHR